MPEEKKSRPLMAAVASQQKAIEATAGENKRLRAAIELIARYAGLSEKLADVLNPGQPVPDPASAGPSETTEEAERSEAADSPLNLGMTPNSVGNLPADANTTALTPGADIPTAPFNELVDVTAPVAGTETHVPLDQTKLEVDVRVGDPDNPQKAFEWTLGGDNGDGANPSAHQMHGASRTFASLKLAKLRLQAGLEEGEELEVAGRIEANASLSNDMIGHETSILSRVASKQTQMQGRQAPRNLVPRSASQERQAPSLVTEARLGSSTAGVTDADMDGSDLFL